MPRNEKREFEILGSAARTATTTYNFALPQGIGFILVVDITARAAATTVTPKLSMRVAGVADLVDVWTAAAALNSANTTVAYLFYPGGGQATPEGYTEETNKALPGSLRLTMTHSDANSVTYSVHGVELP